MSFHNSKTSGSTSSAIEFPFQPCTPTILPSTRFDLDIKQPVHPAHYVQSSTRGPVYPPEPTYMPAPVLPRPLAPETATAHSKGPILETRKTDCGAPDPCSEEHPSPYGISVCGAGPRSGILSATAPTPACVYAGSPQPSCLGYSDQSLSKESSTADNGTVTIGEVFGFKVADVITNALGMLNQELEHHPTHDCPELVLGRGHSCAVSLIEEPAASSIQHSEVLSPKQIALAGLHPNSSSQDLQTSKESESRLIVNGTPKDRFVGSFMMPGNYWLDFDQTTG
ncbi:hypothetical protein RhiJN_22533 [Ceratobasidium sp. AG-Ba]|nr:hypothetical protein RhiJN_22533 [Ceratobasidium sp. AG-Ba]